MRLDPGYVVGSGKGRGKAVMTLKVAAALAPLTRMQNALHQT